MTPAIALEAVSKRYGDARVVDRVDLAVARGASLALVGPSGSGKSTLLRLAIGLVAPDAGRVAIDGEPMTRASSTRLRRAMGYVIQEGALFPHMTARRNAALVAAELGWDTVRIAARVDELRDLVQLPRDAMDRLPSELSGGQRQRVGIMRALFLDPAIVLMDEPLGALDAIVRARLRRDLAAIFARLRKTLLLVTHDLGEAEELASELAVVDGGRIVQRGAAAELRARPATSLVAELVAAASRGTA